MSGSARPRKVEVVVLGRGLAAVALAWLLAEQGRSVALLVESPGLESGPRPGWRGWHRGPPSSLAAAGEEQLRRWYDAGVPGIEAHDAGEWPLWLLDYDLLLPDLADGLRAQKGCFVATGTRVRGISIIENRVLGAIAEDARYDARSLVNAAEDERYAAFMRMMRQPDNLELQPFSPIASPSIHFASDGTPAYPRATPFLRDRLPPAGESLSTAGACRIRGVAGWPLLALGAARHLLTRVAGE
jgi:glycine/D-amino acid oxidase-like deaminating enzyme